MIRALVTTVMHVVVTNDHMHAYTKMTIVKTDPKMGVHAYHCMHNIYLQAHISHTLNTCEAAVLTLDGLFCTCKAGSEASDELIRVWSSSVLAVSELAIVRSMFCTIVLRQRLVQLESYFQRSLTVSRAGACLSTRA